MPIANGTDGGSPIRLYADGSFCAELNIGAWAFTVPTLGHQGAGAESGPTVTRFEFLGILCALEEILAIDASDRPIEVISDCTSSLAAINCLGNVDELKKPKVYADRLDLLPRLQAVLGRRRVKATLYEKGSIDHQDCHRRAGQRLRDEIKARSRFQLPLQRQRNRRQQMAIERAGLLRRLEKLDEEISISEAEIEALEAALERTEGVELADAAAAN